MDLFGFPFRVVPYLPLYMLVAVGVAALMGGVVFGLVWVVHDRQRALAAVPLIRRVTLMWMIVAVVGVYLFPFLLALLIGAPFG